VHEFTPIRAIHTFEVDNHGPKLEMKCEELLWVSDTATESHYTLTNHKNRGKFSVLLSTSRSYSLSQMPNLPEVSSQMFQFSATKTTSTSSTPNPMAMETTSAQHRSLTTGWNTTSWSSSRAETLDTKHDGHQWIIIMRSGRGSGLENRVS